MHSFSIFGAPRILQSDNGRELVKAVIEKLYSMCEPLKRVHGKPRDNHSQGSLGRANKKGY